MAANVAHILSLMVFFGAVAVMDLRLAGFFRATWPGTVLRTARLVAIVGVRRPAGSGVGAVRRRGEPRRSEPGVSDQGRADRARARQHRLVRDFSSRTRCAICQPHTPLPGTARFVRRDVDRDLARGRGLRAADRVFLIAVKRDRT